MNYDISLVVATYNRDEPLHTLLNRINNQTLDKKLWEVIVAVDGSNDDTINILEEFNKENKFCLKWFFQKNAGQCVARHNAILKSNSDRIIIIDDDLNPSEDFIENHLKALTDGNEKTVVIGKVLPVKDVEDRPLYELVRERTNMLMHESFEKGIIRPTGEALITQNVSFYKKFYLDVGGFDPEMRLGEDTLLGIKFEQAGAKFMFCKEAWAIHESNIGSYDTWIKRQYEYGKYTWFAWKKANDDSLHPLKNFYTGNKLNKYAILLLGRSDFLIDSFVKFLKYFGIFLKRINLTSLAVMTYRSIISLKQHQGIIDVYGSWSAFRKAGKEFLEK